MEPIEDIVKGSILQDLEPDALKQLATPPLRPRTAFKDWGDGLRSVGFLITGPMSACQCFHMEVGGEDFGRRGRTSRIRLYLPPDEAEADTIARLKDAASRHGVSLELLHGSGEQEWYELVHLAEHGKRWGKE